MAYDGFFLLNLKKELENELLNRKVEKIYQTNSDEIYISFSRLKEKRLFLSINSNFPSLMLSKKKTSNPLKAPMFSMLIRKHLNAAILKEIKQHKEDRVISFIFETRNTLKDISIKKLIIEVMGRHSNLILTDEDNKVLDSLKRVSPIMSIRAMQPGIIYTNLDNSKKSLSNLKEEKELFLEFLKSKRDEKVEKSLYLYFYGLSPSISKTILIKSEIEKNAKNSSISDEKFERLTDELIKFFEENSEKSKPILYELSKEEFEISSTKLEQYSDENSRVFPNYSDLSYHFLEYKTNRNSSSEKQKNLVKIVERLIRQKTQKKEILEENIQKENTLDDLKLKGELIMANLHNLEKNQKVLKILNYYNNEYIEIEVPDNTSYSSLSQKFFKDYQRCKKTISISKEQIEICIDEINYLETVINNLKHIESDSEAIEIEEELVNENYIKKSKKRAKKHKKLGYRCFKLKSGKIARLGRTGEQNDKLSLRDSKNDELWFHTKDIPSSHLVIRASFTELNEEDFIEAASICASFSKAKDSENVPVDYTKIKYVKKPNRAKAGKVIYTNQKTVYVNPIKKEELEKMKINKS